MAQKLIYALRDLGLFGIDTDDDLETITEKDINEMISAYPKLEGLFSFIVDKQGELTTKEDPIIDSKTLELMHMQDSDSLLSALIYP